MAKSNQRFDKTGVKHTDRNKRTGPSRGVVTTKRGQQALKAMFQGDDLVRERLVRRS